MIRVLIVDDEPLARDCVRLALEKEPDITLLGECGTGEEAVAEILADPPDLVFLDVQMPGLDGFGVIERVGASAMPPVVFVTAYDAHALRAFRMHALDYVLKPFDDVRFRDALAHARAQLQLRREGELGRRLEALLGEMRAPLGGAETTGDAEVGGESDGGSGPIIRFAVRQDDRIVFVRVDDVDWLEADGNYVKLHVRERALRIRASLRALQARLDPARFVRVHKSAIVNLERVKEMQPWFGGDYVAILATGKQVRVSRTYAQDVLKTVQ
jgi:two-component system, LytTR family, response regulator